MGSTVGITAPTAHLFQAQSIGHDPVAGSQEEFHPALSHSMLGRQLLSMKAKASRDPDLPTLRESLTGPNAEQF